MVYRIFNKELKMKVSYFILAISIMTSSALATIVATKDKESGKVCFQYTCDTGTKAGYQSGLLCDDKGYSHSSVINIAETVCGVGNVKVKKIPPSSSQLSNTTMKNLNRGR